MRKQFTCAALASAAALAFCLGGTNVNADEWNHKTIITLDETMKVPGATLAPGTYVMQLANDDGMRSAVSIRRASDNKLITTADTIRLQRNDERGLALEVAMPTGSASVPMLKGWLYPGFGGGHEFVYPKADEQKIANAETVEIPVAPRG